MTLKKIPAAAALFMTLLSAWLPVVAGQINAGRQPRQRRRLTEAIDNRRTVLLPGTTHARIRQARDQGRVRADLVMERAILALKSSPEQEADLAGFLAQQQDPSSPHYHEWLTPRQFGERFGVSAEDMNVIVEWLETRGLHVDQVSNGRREIEFSGTARQIEQVFLTEIHRYEFNGEMHVANATDISIPQALAGIVAEVVSLHDFVSKPKLQRFQSLPNFTFGGRHAMVPYDFATIYDLAPLWNQGFDGTGQTIAIAGRSNLNVNDVATFRSMYGLPEANPEVIVNGTDPGIVSEDEEGEADLDVEWSGAVAKGAKIKFVVSSSTRATDGVVLSEMYIVNNNVAPVMSTSFGVCETASPSTSQFYASLWQQAATQGISVIVASGDSGSAGCDSPSAAPAKRGFSVNGEASTPYNVAVGGTQFNEGGADSVYWNATNSIQNRSSAKVYIPELVWNESGSAGLWSSGGGVSVVHNTPSWQTGYGVPAVDPGTADQHHRYVPDVALTAAGHDGYVIQQGGLLFIASGTSASAPAFAGIMGIVNQVTNQANGNPNPRLYALASQVPTSFHDITSGTNAVPCAADSPNCVDGIITGYSAGPGYDLTTGWGSIDAYVFAHAWATSTVPPPPNTGPPSPPNPPAPNASLTASTYHVFPAFADGTVSDGSYFRSTLMISNPSSSGTNTCTLQLRGLTVPGFAQTPYQLQPNGFVIAPTPATQSLKVGYATLQCTANVEAQLLYSYYSSNGTKLAEAAVFSSPPSTKVQILADTREGAQIGIGIANDSDVQNTYIISVDDGSGTVAGTVKGTLGPRTSIARYLSELMTLPPNYVGRVTVSPTTGTGTSSIIGLRYSGTVFATIPETIQP